MGTLPGPTSTTAEHLAAVAASGTTLLDEIGAGHDLTLVTGPGNHGDELITAGTRQLLGGLIYREVKADELARSTGDTALLIGSGAWCRPYHKWMPRALAVAELRFERVIVLPSSFDVTEDAVRAALERTTATVFAREHESLRHIEGLCRARLAHDCAFFFDFSGRHSSGAGTLNAFRLDREATDGELALTGNDDISLTAAGLEEWLATIERHAHVRTDRAHVMIAAALMGKTVEVAPTAYHKVFALADAWLGGFPVTRIEPPRRPRVPTDPVAVLRDRLTAWSASTVTVSAQPRVTTAILTRDRLEHTQRAVRSALSSTATARVLLIANNPAPSSRRALAALADEDPRIELRALDRNLGCAAGRRLATELVDTELILLIDDDAELIDGSLERLVADLDAHPEAVGVSALVVAADGTVQHCGGQLEYSQQSARFVLDGSKLPFDDPRVPATGPSGWLPATAALIRTAALHEFPIDTGLADYYEDNDWSLRVERERPGSFRRCREAIAIHHGGAAARSWSCELERAFEIGELLSSQARFLHRHGVLLDVDLSVWFPELVLPGDGRRVDLDAVRLLLELVAARGVTWFATELLGGGLDPLLGRKGVIAEFRAAIDEREAAARELTDESERLSAENRELRSHFDWLMARHETLIRVESGGWWRLRSYLSPLLRAGVTARDVMRSRWR